MRIATGLDLHPASTSCRPPCGEVIMVHTEYEDGDRGPDFSMGCRCRTGPKVLLARLPANRIVVRSLLPVRGSCSVSDDSGGPRARNDA